MLNKDRHRLEAIMEAIGRIEEYSADFDNADDFNEDYRNFDACMMNFIVIGEMVEKLSADFKNTYSQVDWKNIKGFRNIVAHDYFGIDAEEVWQIIRERIPVLKADILKIMDF
jgi:uncharacterized protein with HEPN domain